MERAIRVAHLSKKYEIDKSMGHTPLKLSEEIMNLFRRKKSSIQEFWALKNLNFEIEQGETVGLIGRNGSGKSTLLKMLSRVTWPTEGEIELLGSVGALLEVGTGFHVDLTGRENIYLCGAILGMRRKEVQSCFDEIVAFSEIEEFLDTPVKKYSSGMFLRLAFSVMVHLRSQILIIDEIIAVGDQPFQEKCMVKMKQIAKEGRTVIFVSHDLSKIKELCTRVLWLDKGKMVADGETEILLDRYESKPALHDLPH